MRSLRETPAGVDGAMTWRVLVGVSVLMLTAAACDTTAFVSPQIRELSNVQSTGVLVSDDGPTACNLDVTQPNYRLRFTARDTDSAVIEPGSSLAGFEVILGDTFSTQDVEIVNNTGVLYPAPDVTCASDAQCQEQGLPASFTCQRLDERDGECGADGIPCVCGQSINVSLTEQDGLTYIPVEDPRDDDADRSVVALMFTGSTVLGQSYENPGGVNQVFRTDPQDQRLRGFETMLRRLAIPTSPYYKRINFCLATYRNTGASVSPVFPETGAESCFTQLDADDGGFSTLLRLYRERADFGEPGALNWVAALNEVIDLFEGDDSLGDDDERHVVLFVDGDLTNDNVIAENAAQGLGADQVAQRIADAGIHLHVIQLDNPPARDIDAANQPTSFWEPWGPITELAQMACETGGTFTYVETPEALAEAFENVGIGLPASYEASINISDFGSVPSGHYNVSFVMQVRLDAKTVSYRFGGAEGAGNQRSDRRVTVSLQQPCTDSVVCLGHTECVEGSCVSLNRLVEDEEEEGGDAGDAEGT